MRLFALSRSSPANHANSRQSLKKYVRANNKIVVTDAMFDALFNKALRTGVEKGVFEQPKGASLPCICAVFFARD